MGRKLFKPVWLLGLFALACVAGQAFAATDPASPTAVVERFHAALLEGMKGGKAMGFDGRRQRLEPVIKDTFDLAGMTRVSTGAAWQKMSDADRARIVAAFTDWTIASYAGNFKEWDGETFKTKGEKADNKGNVVVETSLVQKDGPPVVFNYRLRKVDDAWRIVDIYLEGAISQIAMHRGEFAAALSQGGVDNLVKHMKDLTAQAQKQGA
jgi:phospholipid transport system substrate-binding protein